MERKLTTAILGAIALVGACGDDAPATPAPTDMGTTDGGEAPLVCLGIDNGTPCAGAGDVLSVCKSGLCVPSRCGDRVVDARRMEDCDDGNMVDGDGCDVDCTFTCSARADCDDGESCTTNDCDTATHRCRTPSPVPDGTACTLPGDMMGECGAGACRAPGCGNGVVVAPEQCDDGNLVDGDGCDGDCTFTCSAPADCDDGNPCNGVEVCTGGGSIASRCSPGTELVCNDMSPCTADHCDPTIGCVFSLIDMDGDGQAPRSLGACGRDCNDMRADVFFGASELCDGVDNDCDGMVDEEAPTWYVDCDGDGFATNATGARTACMPPSASLTGCPAGTASTATWTTLRPTDASSTDCFDGNALAQPNQSAFQTVPAAGRTSAVDFDYNCDGMEERQHTGLAGSSSSSCAWYMLGLRRVCYGSTYWTGTSVPACGATGTLSSCVEMGTSCTRVTATRTQGCR